jgi:hypothetical protein
MGIIFKQQRAVSEEGSANRLLLGKTLGYTAQSLEESLREFLLREDGLLTGLVNQCRMMKAFLC